MSKWDYLVEGDKEARKLERTLFTSPLLHNWIKYYRAARGAATTQINEQYVKFLQAGLLANLGNGKALNKKEFVAAGRSMGDYASKRVVSYGRHTVIHGGLSKDDDSLTSSGVYVGAFRDNYRISAALAIYTSNSGALRGRISSDIVHGIQVGGSTHISAAPGSSVRGDSLDLDPTPGNAVSGKDLLDRLIRTLEAIKSPTEPIRVFRPRGQR